MCLWFYKSSSSSRGMKSSYGPDHRCFAEYHTCSLLDRCRADLCLLKASYQRWLFLSTDIVEPCGTRYWLRNPFLQGLTAFPWHATVYFVNRLVICHPQSVWVWHVSSALRWGVREPCGHWIKASPLSAGLLVQGPPGLNRDYKLAPVDRTSQ